jgi:hypothetical protein
MQEHTIDCPGSQCGNAIEVTDSSSGTSNKVILNDGTVTGCWTVGVKGTGGSDTTVNNFIVDLDGDDTACPSGGTTGMSSVFKLIDHATVSNASGSCIELGSGTLSASLLHNCTDGVQSGPISVANVLIRDMADSALERSQPFGGGGLDLTDVVIQGASCNFKYGFPAPYIVCSNTPPGYDSLHGVNFWDDIID